MWLRPSSSLDMQATCGTFSILLLFHLHSCIVPKESLVFVQNYKILGCSKAKPYYKNLPILSACIITSQDWKLIQRLQTFPCPLHSLLFDHSSILVLELLYPLSLDAFTSSKLESAMQHFFHSATSRKRKLASFPYPPRLPGWTVLPALLFLFTVVLYRTVCLQNPREQPITFSATPPLPQTAVCMVFIIRHLCTHTYNDKIVSYMMASVLVDRSNSSGEGSQ